MTEKIEIDKEKEEVLYEKKWYIIHTYSGYEKKVATDLEKRIESLNLTDRVFRILVPEEEVLEEKRGKMVKVPRKLFPSYVMVEMQSVKEENELGLGYRVDSEAWYVIRNTNGVTGFVGVGSDPIPLSDEEAANLLSKIGVESFNNLNIELKIGETVVIKNDSFMNQEGKIAEIDYEHGKITVLLEVFGRQTPVQVDHSEVSKVEY
ncbi:MAG: transcription termination/antitermination factor NusG [Leptotrichiaceae bacterium]|nr:transcription termination/antitermination factor NusG [Leptotrichiaceae bacterium]MBP6281721.1 transcription termination/antitermination factor NusG [Leptotrichiaceae bacterium]MBP7100616.1 transcription termination/antitermination factor NusG [Leptotrichiaceae bacterium]MBP7739118.1 transcription termination/antitermination factor NusG [Leptotrichiaceae bacterium]MBP9629846.1 transcription termination/antitermination factor NusG [Leptotrichiaceae bacterium]